jgi:hypothetical protein
MNEKLEALKQAKINGGTVTYHFEDGTKTVSQLNKEVFFNEKNRERSDENVLSIFDSIAHDLGATSFEL